MARLDDVLLRTHPENMFDGPVEEIFGPSFSSVLGELSKTLMREAGIGLSASALPRYGDLFTDLVEHFFSEKVTAEAANQIPQGVRRYTKLKALRSMDRALSKHDRGIVLDVVLIARSVANISYDYFSSQQNDLEYSLMELKVIRMFHGGYLLDFIKLK